MGPIKEAMGEGHWKYLGLATKVGTLRSPSGQYQVLRWQQGLMTRDLGSGLSKEMKAYYPINALLCDLEQMSCPLRCLCFLLYKMKVIMGSVPRGPL